MQGTLILYTSYIYLSSSHSTPLRKQQATPSHKGVGTQLLRQKAKCKAPSSKNVYFFVFSSPAKQRSRDVTMRAVTRE